MYSMNGLMKEGYLSPIGALAYLSGLDRAFKPDGRINSFTSLDNLVYRHKILGGLEDKPKD